MKTVVNDLKAKERVSFFTKCLCLYFMLMLCDIFNIGGAGTLLKFYALFLVLMALCYIPKITFVLDRTFVTQIAYLLVCLCSLLYSINYQNSLSDFLTILMNFGLVILCQSIHFSSYEIKVLEKSLVWGGILILGASLFFADYSVGDRLTIQILGDSADQNDINGYLMFAVSYCTYRLINNSGSKFFDFTILFLSFLFVFATGSRGGLLSLTSVIFVLLFIKVKNKKRDVIKVVFLLIGLLLIFQLILSFLPQEVAIRYSFTYIEENGTTSRFDIWDALLTRFFNDNAFSILFGKGVSTSSFYNTFDFHVAHNIFIEILIGTGFVGLIIYLVLIISLFKKAWKSQQYSLFAAFVGLMVMGMSLSLIKYKPIFNAFIMIEIAYKTFKRNQSRNNMAHLVKK